MSLGDVLVVAAPTDVGAAIVVVGGVAPAADEGVASEVAVAIVHGAAASLVEVLEQEYNMLIPFPCSHALHDLFLFQFRVEVSMACQALGTSN